MNKFKKGDQVIVVSGKDKGTVGEILSVDVANQSVIVKGVSVRKKCVKRSQENPEGGIFDIETSISWSNVMIVDPKDGKGTRVRIQSLADGSKVRVSVRSGEEIGK
tara:strand:- start:630 stop:947 length:318 start_codon:yes stop_codon:yes gene_type:complete